MPTPIKLNDQADLAAGGFGYRLAPGSHDCRPTPSSTESVCERGDRPIGGD
jgi:hypothetical protein